MEVCAKVCDLRKCWLTQEDGFWPKSHGQLAVVRVFLFSFAKSYAMTFVFEVATR